MAYEGKPLFTLVPLVKKSNIDPGDYVEIELYITGSGKISVDDNLAKSIFKNKVFVSVPSLELIDIKEGFNVQSCIIMTVKDDHVFAGTGKKFIQKGKITDKIFFMRLPPTAFAINTKEQLEQFHLPTIMSEWTWDGMPPTLIKFKTNTKSPSGDYDINLVLTYSFEGNNYQSKEKVSIHVTSWIERNSKALTLIGLILSLPYIEFWLSSIINMIKSFLLFLCP